jgi:hypothetical protein
MLVSDGQLKHVGAFGWVLADDKEMFAKGRE